MDALKTSISVFFLFVVFLLGRGQDYRTSNFLELSLSSPAVQMHGEASDFLIEEYRGIPAIDELELRAEMNQMQLDLMDYKLRLKTNALLGVTENNRLKSSTLELNRLAALATFNRVLKTRYNVLVDYFEVVMTKPILDSMGAYFETFEDYVRKDEVNTSTDWIKGLISFEEDELDYRIRKKEYELLQQEVFKEVQLLGGDLRLADEIEVLPSADFIIDWLISMDSSNIQSMDLVLLQAEIDVNKSRVEFERKSGIQFFNFIEAGYSQGDALRDRNPYSMQVGFNIPIANKNRGEINKMTVRQIEAEIEYHDEKYAIDEELHELRSQMYFQYDLYLIYNDYLKNSYTAKALKNQRVGASTMVVLESRGKLLDVSSKMNDAYFELLRLWVDYLDLSGMMIREPFVNYLNTSFPRIIAEN